METRNFQAGASASPPTAPASPSNGYATNGNPGTGVQATQPGEFWFHKIGEELRSIITAAGLTPSDSSLVQLISALTAGWGMARSFASNGYQKLPGGLILQWGSTTTSASADVAVSFPMTFPSAVYSIQFGAYSYTTNGGSVGSNNLTTSGFNINGWHVETGTNSRQGISVKYIAIGY